MTLSSNKVSLPRRRIVVKEEMVISLIIKSSAQTLYFARTHPDRKVLPHIFCDLSFQKNVPIQILTLHNNLLYGIPRQTCMQLTYDRCMSTCK